MTPCPPISHPLHHALHPLRRAIRHHLRHHIGKYLAATLTTGCIGTPIAVIALAPPTLARPIEAPQPVPEPGAIWVLASGVAGIVAIRRAKQCAA